MPYVQLIKLVLAASPRKQLTLSQIYGAFEERWPFFQTEGNTWKNSIRHTLSLQGTFENVERPAYDIGAGKGGYWKIKEKPKAHSEKKVKSSNVANTTPSDLGHGHPLSLPLSTSPTRPKTDPSSLRPPRKSKDTGKEKDTEKAKTHKPKRPKTSPFPLPIPVPTLNITSNTTTHLITPTSKPSSSPVRPDSPWPSTLFRYQPHPPSPTHSYPLPNPFDPPAHPILQQEAQIRLQTQAEERKKAGVNPSGGIGVGKSGRQYWNDRSGSSYDHSQMTDESLTAEKLPNTPLSAHTTQPQWIKIPSKGDNTTESKMATRTDWIPEEVVFSHSLPVRSHSYPWKVFPKVRKGWKRDDERRIREGGLGEHEEGVEVLRFGGILTPPVTGGSGSGGEGRNDALARVGGAMRDSEGMVKWGKGGVVLPSLGEMMLGIEGRPKTG